MSTLAEASARAALASRIRQLALDTTPAWGKMSAQRMLAHCADAMRMAYGEFPVAPRDTPLTRNFFVKRLILYVLPFPKSAPTAPELLVRDITDGEIERQALLELIARFPGETSRTEWPAHPLFGPMSAAEWGRLGYKHLDHHLSQFRV
ncbi:MAG: DUF1569 domain-containing protein [Gemmatimonadaceae bacterium]|nr:DUF1569 domain-containing protein [Gemmatimonadaceae bacterium]